MNPALLLPVSVLLVAGCASSRPAARGDAASAPAGAGPNWDEVDKTVQHVREREGSKLRMVETERVVEAGYFAMTEEEYAAALESAREEVRKANPKLSDAEVETEATKRADEAKRRQENSYSRRASSTYELKRP